VEPRREEQDPALFNENSWRYFIPVRSIFGKTSPGISLVWGQSAQSNSLPRLLHLNVELKL